MAVEPTGLEAERQRSLDGLRKLFADDAMTMDDYADSVGSVLAATNLAELHSAVGELELAPAAAVVGQQPRTSNVVISIFGGNDRKGRWRVPAQLRVFALFGGTRLDLREASTAEFEVKITSFSAFGGVEVIVPEGIDAELSGFAIFGGNNTDLAAVPVLPGTPIVRVRAIAIFGGVTVRSKPHKH